MHLVLQKSVVVSEAIDVGNEDNSETNQCEAFSASVFTSINNLLCCGEKDDKRQRRLGNDDDVDECVDWWLVICVCEGCRQLDRNQRCLNVSAGFVSFVWCWRLKTDSSIVCFLL